MEVLHFIFGVFGNATALFLFLAPTITFQRIVKSKSTEKFSGVPYVMTLLNCLLSAWYGLPFVSKNNMLVSTINGAGVAIESTYVLIFLVYAPKMEKRKMMRILTTVLAVFSMVALVSLFALHGRTRKLFCGLAATIFSILMYASPLSVMRLVIKTKSVEFMPFFLSLFVFLCGTSWFIYGLLGHDPFIASIRNFLCSRAQKILTHIIEVIPNPFGLRKQASADLHVPNGFGCGLGAMQLILYAVYHKGKGHEEALTNDESIDIDSDKIRQDSQMNMNPSHRDNQV